MVVDAAGRGLTFLARIISVTEQLLIFGSVYHQLNYRGQRVGGTESVPAVGISTIISCALLTCHVDSVQSISLFHCLIQSPLYNHNTLYFKFTNNSYLCFTLFH